jgi:glutamate racemase
VSTPAADGPAGRAARSFDVVFTDTCLGGSTVAARVGSSAAGLRGFYLADYAVNPLGVKSQAEVRAALERWMRIARLRAPTLVVACNTASVLLEQAPDLLATAAGEGLRVLSMVHLFDRALASAASSVQGKRVCVMGTRFTVSQPVYRDRLIRAGAAEVLPLAATRTERTIARLKHTTDDGRREIADEAGESVRRSDVVVLACTLFPLVGPLLHELNPACVLVDPACGVDGAFAGASRGGTNRLTIALTGHAVALDDVRAQADALFPGWTIASIEAGEADEASRDPQ